jgi:methionyl-tRNA formyltransferase
MQMDEGLDTGPIILQQDIEINNATLTELHDLCAQIGATLLEKAISQIDELPRIPQSAEGISYAHKLSKQEARINWQNYADKINAQIRGMNPWPGSFFIFNDMQIKVLKAHVIKKTHSFEPGRVLTNNLAIACKTDCLQIEELQKPGGKAMTAADFLRGLQIAKDTLLL